ncbi:hypothetical protein [Brevibacillus sp. NRS-1366]|uniref:cysteine dioxygenase family protein n=1 Tax=Brevibacillus sp. NRS-1366 TaxID=3233899 RepID=UPI003D1C6AAF
MNPSLQKFIADVDAIVRNGGDEYNITKRVAARMQELLGGNDILPAAFMKPNPDKYTLYPVYVAPDDSFSIASAVWDVGQSTPIHDHGTWGVIGIVQGTEYEVRYSQPSSNGQTPLVRLEDRYIRKGEVEICCTRDQDIHEVTCASDEPCVGLHVYGANIGKITRHTYERMTGDKNVVVTAWEPAPFEK